ncbi:SGNH/GDSL hydrolase family protein [Streptomyces sp. UNOC14_S4]|nr:SGNH/GDSL hydrolase family protein [Streptomyces sp. UNOC14_S4]
MAGLVCTLSTAVLPTASATNAADAADVPPVRYVALGDSIASGVGAGDYDAASGNCLRSRHSYPQLWTDSHQVAAFTSAACSHATTQDVIDKQLGKLSRDTTLVSITAGANDVSFGETMATCTAGTDKACLDKIHAAEAAIRDRLPKALSATYRAIGAKAPKARVTVLGYPRLFTTGGACLFGLSTTKREAIDEAADQLNAVTERAARQRGFAFGNAARAFTGHEICAKDAWIHSVRLLALEESYHPTEQGYESGYLPTLSAVTGP